MYRAESLLNHKVINKTVAIVTALLMGISTLQAQNFEWARTFGASDDDDGYSIAVDGLGNVYTAGIFHDVVDFDPGAGVVNLTSNGGWEIFVQKMDADGNFLWAKSFGGVSNDICYSIAVDAFGGVYTTGNYKGTVDFDPGAGTANLTPNGGWDVFIQKMDANGNFLWAKSFGGSSDDLGYSIEADASGNVYTTGFFYNTVDFDPGAGIANLTSSGGQDIFVQKLDADGNFLWAKSFGGGSNDIGYSIAIDGSGNVYTAGNFRSTADFDPGAGTANLTSSGGYDVFVQKMDANGNFLWAKSFGGTAEDFVNSVAADGLGNVYTTGYFNSTADFDPGAAVVNRTSNGGQDIFVQKMDANGNFLWAKTLGGTSSERGNSITVDASGSVYIVGNFQGIVNFDPIGGTANLTSKGGYDVYVHKMDANGNFLWAVSFGGGTSFDLGISIAVDLSGNIFTTGGFGSIVDFDPGQGVYNLTSFGGADIFVHKMSSPFQCTNTSSSISPTVCNSYTSPSGSYTWINSGIYMDTILNKAGCDSVITVNLTVNHSTAGSVSPTVCNSYTSPSGKYTWTTNGTYKDTISNKAGCDSVITVNLTVNHSTAGSVSPTVCNSYTSPSGSHTWTTNGTYMDTIPNQAGCDSVITVNLTVGFSNAGSLTSTRDTICEGAPAIISTVGSVGTLQWQSSSVLSGGFNNIPSATDSSIIEIPVQTTYYRVYATGSGCVDSSAPYKIIVKPSPVADFSFTISNRQVAFTNNSSDATRYVWDFADSSPSTTEISPVHDYAADGIYHVCMDAYNGSNCSFRICKDVQIGYSGVASVVDESNWTVYPNPFKEVLFISKVNHTNHPESIQIYDLYGRECINKSFDKGQRNLLQMDLSVLAKGIYILKIKTDIENNIPSTFKIVKLK